MNTINFFTMLMAPPKPFLTAEWRDLIALNYDIDPKLLLPHLPAGTELDLWNGRALISLVAFRFLKTRVWGVAIPLHTDFLEINLRFYVRRRAPDGWRRGVVFLKELVPRLAISTLARLLYNENYCCARMTFSDRKEGAARKIQYGWSYAGQSHQLDVSVNGSPQLMQSGSENEFIFEHYWGYSAQRKGPTLEYAVEHVPWRILSDPVISFDYPNGFVYGGEFDRILCGTPTSSLLAEGSEISVYRGVPLAP